jgi:O-antigen ligase
MASRTTPWQNTMDAIHEHFWFGTGFGTSDKGEVAGGSVGRFATSSATSNEHGSGYLAIVSWVGMLGVLPFFLLLGALLSKAIQTIVWMSRSRDPSHGAVPLAFVVLAGLIHAGFEDWLFAPGYYLCVFFWSVAFVLEDLAPSLTVSERRSMFLLRGRTMRQDLRAVAPSR